MVDHPGLQNLIKPPAWYLHASCRPYPTAMFFLEGRDSNLSLQAKLVCMECPVRIRCLEHGFSVHHGVFGGTSPLDRSRLRRAIKRNEDVMAILEDMDDRTYERASKRKITKPNPKAIKLV